MLLSFTRFILNKYAAELENQDYVTTMIFVHFYRQVKGKGLLSSFELYGGKCSQTFDCEHEL
jgi:hypothetical protein